MRALIRAVLDNCPSHFPDRQTDRANYDAEIIKLLRAVGYHPRTCSEATSEVPTQTDLEVSEDVKRLFEGVPDPTKDEELKHLVMLGYTSDGQAKFVVCSINQRVLHIRVRDDLFEKLRRACREIQTLTRRCGGLHFNRVPWPGTFGLLPIKRRVRIRIKSPIEVMEPNHGHATIEGKIIQRPFVDLARLYPAETLIACFTLILSIILFLKTPEWAQPLTTQLARWKQFQPGYVQGALERVYSALLVTFVVTTIDLCIKFRELWRNRPILWNAGIEPTAPK